VATTKVEEDVDGGPLGVLPRAPAAATIVVDEDVRRRAPWVCCRELWQWPPS
jgi:hypothetical protein